MISIFYPFHLLKEYNIIMGRLKNSYVVGILITLQVLIRVGGGTPIDVMECLLEDNLKVSCVQGVDVDHIAKQQREKTNLMCPFFIQLLERAMSKDNKQLIDVLDEKSSKLCQIAVKVNPKNGILLFGLELIRGQLLKSLQIEYQTFFHQPFGHEVKFKQMLKITSEHLKKTRFEQQSEPLQLTIKLFYEGNLQQCVKLLQKYQDTPEFNNEYVFLLRIRIMQIMGQFPQALSLVSKALQQKLYNSHWYLYHLKGNLLMHHLRFRQAVGAFEQSIISKGKEPFGFSLYNIGLCYQKMGKYDKSINYLRKIEVRGAEVWNSLGLSYSELVSGAKSEKESKNYMKNAEKYYMKAINADNKYYIAHFNLAVLKYEQKQYQQAIRSFQSAIKLNPNNTNISSKYGLLKALYKRDKNQGLSFLQQQLLSSEGCSFGDIGMILHELQQRKMAKQYLEKAIQEKSNLAEIYERKGVIQFELGQNEEAIASFKKAIQKGNKKSTVWFNLGYAEQLRGNFQQALAYYQKASQIDPNGPAQSMINGLNKKQQQKQSKPSGNQL